MSYQVLARKWRPNNFSELVGQEHVVTAISNALDNDRLHHAYLFTGTRGVGKTTIARIFSKSLNCEQGMGSKPCGQCATCKEIEQGNYIDLLEIDAASRTKVEDTRELLDNVQYRPTRGSFKVYLIDEVHMLSKHSFNALLKTLEEPPPHVKFLLATTDPQKLPITILSRCLQFNLKALSRTQIAKQLEYVFQQEKIQSEPEAISQLARAAQGSMRDALSLADQAVAQGNGQVSLAIVTDMLGLMDKNQVLKLLNCVLQRDSQAAFAAVDKMSEQAPDYGQILSEIMSLLHQVALTQFVPEACKLETISARAIFQLAKSMAPEQVQLLYQIALQGKKDLPFAADTKTGLEMTLLRMLAFTPVNKSFSADVLMTQTPAPVTATTLANVEIASGKQAEQSAPTEQNTELGSAPALESDKAPMSNDQQMVTHESANEVLAITEPQASPSSPHNTDKAQFTSANSTSEQDEFEQQQDLIAQQQDIMHEAEGLITQFIPESETSVFAGEHDSAGLPTQNTTSKLPDAGQGNINSTESLLALKRKLHQDKIALEEQSSSVKKSESTFDPGRFLPGGASITDSRQAVTKVTGFAENTSVNEIPLSKEDGADLAPPWSTGEEVDPEMTTAIKRQTLATSKPVEIVESLFDSTAHLSQDLECQVDYDVPAFLESGEKVRSAQQLDSWSQLIAQMQVAALTKQLALHSEFIQQGDNITLNLLGSKQHLHTESAQVQLQQALSDVLQRNIKLEIIVDQALNTPFALQQTINKVRLEYAHQVVKSDPNINRIKDTFAAQVLVDTIKPI
ncbi:MAG: DNA polymerase-3 subunit gamma/tau [Paraglaciecola sp.]|jgi:DNA polymerase-3 subunit gamma/tau